MECWDSRPCCRREGSFIRSGSNRSSSERPSSREGKIKTYPRLAVGGYFRPLCELSAAYISERKSFVMSDRKKFIWIVAAFLFFYFLPADNPRVHSAAIEAFAMLHEYARSMYCFALFPFFIAGAISVFVSQQSVMKYLGNQAQKIVSYSVAAVSGTILAVCSCTVLPLFAKFTAAEPVLACVCLSLFRPGHQHPRHYIDSPSSWF